MVEKKGGLGALFLAVKALAAPDKRKNKMVFFIGLLPVRFVQYHEGNTLALFYENSSCIYDLNPRILVLD